MCPASIKTRHARPAPRRVLHPLGAVKRIPSATYCRDNCSGSGRQPQGTPPTAVPPTTAAVLCGQHEEPQPPEKKWHTNRASFEAKEPGWARPGGAGAVQQAAQLKRSPRPFCKSSPRLGRHAAGINTRVPITGAGAAADAAGAADTCRICRVGFRFLTFHSKCKLRK